MIELLLGIMLGASAGFVAGWVAAHHTAAGTATTRKLAEVLTWIETDGPLDLRDAPHWLRARRHKQKVTFRNLH